MLLNVLEMQNREERLHTQQYNEYEISLNYNLTSLKRIIIVGKILVVMSKEIFIILHLRFNNTKTFIKIYYILLFNIKHQS